jgi:uncharacterized protein (DUF2141 family)
MKLIFSLFLWCGSGFLHPDIPSTLQVQIQGAASDQGKILVLVFNSRDGFPDVVSKAYKQLELVPKSGKAEMTLTDLPSGKYAIVVLHDVDDNGGMTSNRFGVPQEKYGFSNNPKIYFSPPSFDKSAIELKSESKQVTIHLR